jgi:hypothetical protein
MDRKKIILLLLFLDEQGRKEATKKEILRRKTRQKQIDFMRKEGYSRREIA